MSAGNEGNSNKPRKYKRHRRTNGSGSITKKSNGKWVGKITVNNLGGPRDIYRVAKTKREVKRLLDEIITEIEENPLGFYTPKNGNEYIYFIQGEGGGPIKIGITSDVNKRLSSMQTGSPTKLRVRLVIPNASREIEQQLHQDFAPYRLHGEWFRPASIINRYIQSHKKQR